MKNILISSLVCAALSFSITASAQNPNANVGAHTTTGIKTGPTTTTGGAKPKPKTATKTSTSKTGATKTATIKVNTSAKPNTTTTTTTTGGTGGKGGGNTTTTSNTGTPSTGSGGKGGGTTTGGSTTGGTQTTGGSNVLQTDAANAIKQALTIGIQAAVGKVSVTDGYFGNPAIKIPLPQEISMVEEGLRMVGAGSYVDQLVVQLNRSAEQSATAATPIFINSITQLSINDAVNIVSGQQQDAATQFLKRTTTEQLVVAFKPQVQAVLDRTYTTTIWNQVTTYYNKIPFISPVTTDLNDYVTRKALDGLFYMVAQEEIKIRQNPTGQASDIIGKVFGSVLKR
jgi:hypothetical protein